MSNVRAHMSFHLWRTDRLARDLAANRVPEHFAVRYMMLGAVLSIEANYAALWYGTYRDWVFFLELLVVLTVSLIGVNECYRANGGTQGTQFITRLCALAVPIGLKITVVGTVLGYGFYYVAPYILAGAFRDPQLVYRYVWFLMPVTLTFVYYWRIAHHISTVRALEEKDAL